VRSSRIRTTRRRCASASRGLPAGGGAGDRLARCGDSAAPLTGRRSRRDWWTSERLPAGGARRRNGDHRNGVIRGRRSDRRVAGSAEGRDRRAVGRGAGSAAGCHRLPGAGAGRRRGVDRRAVGRGAGSAAGADRRAVGRGGRVAAGVDGHGVGRRNRLTAGVSGGLFSPIVGAVSTAGGGAASRSLSVDSRGARRPGARCAC
jgi:hypothetical protein